MTSLDLTAAETAGLADALSVAEAAAGRLTPAQASAAAKLDSPAAPEGRYDEPAAGATTWDAAFPALTAETAAAILHEILIDSGFALTTIECADDPLAVTVLDMLEAFRGNCWDDQHDGGAHRQDLIDVNRLVRHLGDPDGDDLAEVLALPSDDAPDDERWAARS